MSVGVGRDAETLASMGTAAERWAPRRGPTDRARRRSSRRLDVTAFDPGVRVHVVGVGGAGMSGLARLLVEAGAVVSGSDLADSAVLEGLRTLGVSVAVGHDATNASNADVVLWSPAWRATTSNS